jgi:hypothetical protein
MNTDEIVFTVVDYLNEHDVPYMIVGSLATNVYCVPRSTEDGDFVIQGRVAQFARDISREHPNVRFDPQLGFESVTATTKVVLQTDNPAFEVELLRLVGADVRRL